MTQRSGSWVEKRVCVFASLVVFGFVAYLVIRNERFADPNLVVLVRIMLATATAVIGATVPGFFEVDWSTKGLTIRATGAVAFFLVTFGFTPDVLGPKTPDPPPRVSVVPEPVDESVLRSGITDLLHSGKPEQVVEQVVKLLSKFVDPEAKKEECNHVLTYLAKHNRVNLAESIERECWE